MAAPHAGRDGGDSLLPIKRRIRLSTSAKRCGLHFPCHWVPARAPVRDRLEPELEEKPRNLHNTTGSLFHRALSDYTVRVAEAVTLMTDDACRPFDVRRISGSPSKPAILRQLLRPVLRPRGRVPRPLDSMLARHAGQSTP